MKKGGVYMIKQEWTVMINDRQEMVLEAVALALILLVLLFGEDVSKTMNKLLQQIKTSKIYSMNLRISSQWEARMLLVAAQLVRVL
jgi:hypothetical protein